MNNAKPTGATPTALRVADGSAWVRVMAPGIDVMCQMDDAESDEIVACALKIAARRRKLPDQPPAPALNLTGNGVEGGESCQPPAVSGEDSR
jgi:hypothetical protein